MTSGSTLTINDINEVYISLLNENHVNPGTRSRQKNPKKIINEGIEDVNFMKSYRVYVSKYLISEKLQKESVNDVTKRRKRCIGIKCRF